MAKDKSPGLAFRCKVCGRLEDTGAAGEAAQPSLCRVCGGNAWTVLASATDEELETWQIDRSDVVEHILPTIGEVPEPVPEEVS